MQLVIVHLILENMNLKENTCFQMILISLGGLEEKFNMYKMELQKLPILKFMKVHGAGGGNLSLDHLRGK